jgi:hypothetical protein
MDVVFGDCRHTYDLAVATHEIPRTNHHADVGEPRWRIALPSRIEGLVRVAVGEHQCLFDVIFQCAQPVHRPYDRRVIVPNATHLTIRVDAKHDMIVGGDGFQMVHFHKGLRWQRFAQIGDQGRLPGSRRTDHIHDAVAVVRAHGGGGGKFQ